MATTPDLATLLQMILKQLPQSAFNLQSTPITGVAGLPSVNKSGSGMSQPQPQPGMSTLDWLGVGAMGAQIPQTMQQNANNSKLAFQNQALQSSQQPVNNWGNLAGQETQWGQNALQSTQLNPYKQQQDLAKIQWMRNYDPASMMWSKDANGRWVQAGGGKLPSFNTEAYSDNALANAQAAFSKAQGLATGGQFRGTPLAANFADPNGTAQADIEHVLRGQQRTTNDWRNSIVGQQGVSDKITQNAMNQSNKKANIWSGILGGLGAGGGLISKFLTGGF